MNLFLVTSPLQLLCAIEAKHHFRTSNNILIVREEKSQSAVRQMRVLLDKSEWDHVIFIGRKSKVWEARKLHSKLKSIHNSLSFLYIFYADYSAWRTNVLLNNIEVKHEVMFDDGVGTVRNVVHLRGAALRLTGYRVFDIFTALGRFGLGRLSIKRMDKSP
ncbi:hypothetical protein QO226_19245, partial [Vibrio vulnificus]|nr:hypothetical protein [Vibrio vulnificus]